MQVTMDDAERVKTFYARNQVKNPAFVNSNGTEKLRDEVAWCELLEDKLTIGRSSMELDDVWREWCARTRASLTFKQVMNFALVFPLLEKNASSDPLPPQAIDRARDQCLPSRQDTRDAMAGFRWDGYRFHQFHSGLQSTADLHEDE